MKGYLVIVMTKGRKGKEKGSKGYNMGRRKTQ